MNFTFSIRAALKRSWQLYAQHALFFSSMAFVMIIFNVFSNTHHNPLSVTLVTIAAVLWGYVWLSVVLTAADGKAEVLSFASLSAHMPNARQFLTFVGVGIATGLAMIAAFLVPIVIGTILVSPWTFVTMSMLGKVLTIIFYTALFVPGIYVSVRLFIATIVYVDRQGSLVSSLRYAWHLERGRIFWTAFLIIIIEIALLIAGSLLLMIGLLITYPLALLLHAFFYRALTEHYRQHAIY